MVEDIHELSLLCPNVNADNDTQYGAEIDGHMLTSRGSPPAEGTYTQPEHGLELAGFEIFE